MLVCRWKLKLHVPSVNLLFVYGGGCSRFSRFLHVSKSVLFTRKTPKTFIIRPSRNRRRLIFQIRTQKYSQKLRGANLPPPWSLFIWANAIIKISSHLKVISLTLIYFRWCHHCAFYCFLATRKWNFHKWHFTSITWLRFHQSSDSRLHLHPLIIEFYYTA